MPSVTFFLIVTEQLNIKNLHKGDAISFPENFPSLKIIPTIAAEMKSIIHFLKPKNTAGYDEVTSKSLKTFAAVVSHPLSFICNQKIYTGIFPDRLKIAIVKLLYKKGHKSSRTHYRPILFLTVLSKVLEEAMHSRLTSICILTMY
jgi:hypothetical protein